MILESYLFHLRARNLSPRTIKATREYLAPFLARHDPLTVTRRDVEGYLAAFAARCRPASVFTAWRHLRGFFGWLTREGDIDTDPMVGVPKPIVPPTEIPMPTVDQVRLLLASCAGRTAADRRDFALIAVMLDSGLRVTEAANLKLTDISDTFTVRVFGKGRKWRTVQLGKTSSTAIRRWLRVRQSDSDYLWIGRNGPLKASGIQQLIRRRGRECGLRLHPHMLRHCFVDNWLRNGGSEIDLARLCGWTTTRMAGRYAQHRADERAIAAHAIIQPLDRLH